MASPGPYISIDGSLINVLPILRRHAVTNLFVGVRKTAPFVQRQFESILRFDSDKIGRL